MSCRKNILKVWPFAIDFRLFIFQLLQKMLVGCLWAVLTIILPANNIARAEFAIVFPLKNNALKSKICHFGNLNYYISTTNTITRLARTGASHVGNSFSPF